MSNRCRASQKYCSIIFSLLLFWASPSTAEEPLSKGLIHWDWHHQEILTWKQSISQNEQIAQPERTRLLSAIMSRFRTTDFDSQDQLRTTAAETRIKYVDLNDDGIPEVIAQAGGDRGCSPTGNCTFWVFRRVGDTYTLLLESDAQTFSIQPTRSNNLYDLLLTRHDSAYESEIKPYKFDGKMYRKRGCYDAEWTQLDSDGEYHDLKEPVISRCTAP